MLDLYGAELLDCAFRLNAPVTPHVSMVLPLLPQFSLGLPYGAAAPLARQLGAHNASCALGGSVCNVSLL